MSDTTPWIKATASGSQGGDCVEMRRHAGVVEMRDSKDPDGGTLRAAPAAFAALINAAKNGELDHLA